MEIKQRRLQILKETVEYYSVDPKNRRCIEKGVCKYSPKSLNKEGLSEGCAVGRLLSGELQEKLDNSFRGDGVSNDGLFEALLKDIQELGQRFLEDLQDLHDYNYYWNDSDLNRYGKDKVIEIEERIDEDWY